MSHLLIRADELLWPSDLPDTVIRAAQRPWLQQAFELDLSLPFGFTQHHNGPCIVLSAVTAACVRLLLEETKYSLVTRRSMSTRDRRELDTIVLRAIARILAIAAQARRYDEQIGPARDKEPGTSTRQLLPPAPIRLVTIQEPKDQSDASGSASESGLLKPGDTSPSDDSSGRIDWESLWSTGEWASRLQITECRGLREAEQALLSMGAQAGYTRAGDPGTVLLLLSALLTRGAEEAMEEGRRADSRFRSLVVEDSTAEAAVAGLLLAGRLLCPGVLARWADPGGREWSGGMSPLCGFLTDEDGYGCPGPFLRPVVPVWMVLTGGHCTTLWAEPGVDPHALSALEDVPPARATDKSASASVGDGTTEGNATAASDEKGPGSGPGGTPATGSGDCQSSPDAATGSGDCQSSPDAAADAPVAAEAGPRREAVTDDMEPVAYLGPWACTKGATASAPVSAAAPAASAGGGHKKSTSGSPGAEAPWEHGGAPRAWFRHHNGTTKFGSVPRLARFEAALWGQWDAAAGSGAAAGEPSGPAAGSGAAAGESSGPESGAGSKRGALGEQVGSREQENLARKVRRVLMVQPLPGCARAEGPWRFCVVCDPNGSMEKGEPTAPFPGRFYCRDCMLQNPPNYGGYAREGDTVCPGCGAEVSRAGHSHWLSLEQLPREHRWDWERQNAPHMLKVLRLRWPRAVARFDKEGPPRLLA